MDTLRYALSGLFVIVVATGLLLLVHAETRRATGESRGAGVARAARPVIWFGCAAALFATIVILTLLFPVAG